VRCCDFRLRCFFFDFRFRFGFGFRLNPRRFRFGRRGFGNRNFLIWNVYGDNVVVSCQRSLFASIWSKHTEFPAESVRESVFDGVRM